MTWEASEESIRDAVVNASGLPDTSVVWQHKSADGDWITYPRIKLTAVRNAPYGQPFEVHIQNTETGLVEREVWGVTLLTVTIRLETDRTAEGLGAFFSPGDRIPKVLRTPEVSEVLTAGSASLVAVRELASYTAPEANRELSAVVFEALFQINAPVDTTPAGGAGWFNTVRISSTNPTREFTSGPPPEESGDDMASIERIYPLTGTTDYMLDAAWAQAVSSNRRETSNMLGDGIAIPRFYVTGRSAYSAFRLTAEGLRMEYNNTHGLGDDVWPMFDGGGCMVIPLPVHDSIVVDYTMDSNLPALAPVGAFAMEIRAGIVEFNLTGRPRFVFHHSVIRNSFVNGGDVTEEINEPDIFAAPVINIQASVASGMISRRGRLVIDGPFSSVQATTPPAALADRFTRIDPLLRTPVQRRAFVLGIGHSIAPPPAGFYARLRALSVRVDRL